jgi:hypothetical protein
MPSRKKGQMLFPGVVVRGGQCVVAVPGVGTQSHPSRSQQWLSSGPVDNPVDGTRKKRGSRGKKRLRTE